MKIAKNRTTSTAIALILMFAMAASMIALPVHAPIRDEWPTWLLINAAPNPVGVGQCVYANVFMSNPTPTASGARGDAYEGITVEVVRPDGTKETFGPYMADPTGGIWVTYVPPKTGNYTFQAFYPGQILDGVNPNYPNQPAWGYGTEAMWKGMKLKASQSEKITLVVQEDPIGPIYKTPPLPTEYWTRSITAQNWDWGKIAGNWMDLPTVWQGNYSASNVQLYTTAPNSPHILWKKETHLGGVVGWPTESDQESQYMLTSMIISYISDPLILNGIMYYHDYIGASQTFGGATGDVGKWHAVDIRTGEEVWSRAAGETSRETIAFVQPLTWHTRQEFGAWGYLYTSYGGNWRIYDAKSGAYLANITGATGSVSFMDFDCKEQGTLISYYTTSNQSGVFLNKWNGTQLLAYPSGFPSSGVHASTIRVSGNYNFTAGLWSPGGWTKKIDTTFQGQNTSMSIAIRTPEVIMLRYTSDPTSFVSANIGWQLTAGYSAETGAKLWGPLNQTLPELEALSLRCSDDEVYVIDSKTTRRAWGYSIKTGKQLWGPVTLPGNAWSHLSRTGACAYGKAFISDFGGYVNCIDLQTGNIDWTFTRGSAGYDTPFGVYTQWYWSDSSFCDGKLFLKEGHEYNPPQFPGRLLAINATSGELVWSILFTGVKSQIVHADSIAIDWNANDGSIYAFGKGPTRTTVSIQNDVTTFGRKVLVTGMVTDVSAGMQEYDKTARFPNGVAAISDEDQRQWMEYVYMQQSCPGNAKGVEVTLDALDPNNNFVHIGTATSDTSGTYSCVFTPEVPGKYTIISTFAGSESYWASYAETALYVEEAPPATPPPEYPVPADYTLTIISTGIAIIIAVAIATVLILRKRQ